jgi:hypothetical protein
MMMSWSFEQMFSQKFLRWRCDHVIFRFPPPANQREAIWAPIMPATIQFSKFAGGPRKNNSEENMPPDGRYSVRPVGSFMSFMSCSNSSQNPPRPTETVLFQWTAARKRIYRKKKAQLYHPVLARSSLGIWSGPFSTTAEWYALL